SMSIWWLRKLSTFSTFPSFTIPSFWILSSKKFIVPPLVLRDTPQNQHQKNQCDQQDGAYKHDAGAALPYGLMRRCGFQKAGFSQSGDNGFINQQCDYGVQSAL